MTRRRGAGITAAWWLLWPAVGLAMVLAMACEDETSPRGGGGSGAAVAVDCHQHQCVHPHCVAGDSLASSCSPCAG